MARNWLRVDRGMAGTGFGLSLPAGTLLFVEVHAGNPSQAVEVALGAEREGEAYARLDVRDCSAEVAYELTHFVHLAAEAAGVPHGTVRELPFLVASIVGYAVLDWGTGPGNIAEIVDQARDSDEWKHIRSMRRGNVQ